MMKNDNGIMWFTDDFVVLFLIITAVTLYALGYSLPKWFVNGFYISLVYSTGKKGVQLYKSLK